MHALRPLIDGGYDFLEGVFPYSQGVIAHASPALDWRYCRPSIEGIEFEMDLRRVAAERLLRDS